MKYKILYLAFIGDEFGGVEQKIFAQLDAFVASGTVIDLVLVSKYKPKQTLEKEITRRSNIKILINSTSKNWNPWIRRKEKFDLITSILNEYDSKNTLVYFRYPLADFLFMRFLDKNKKFKFITEHQEIENRLKIGFLRLNCIEDILDIFFGKSVRKRISGFVGVTSEILNIERSYIQNKDHFFAAISNGVDVSKIHLRKYPFFDGKTLKLLFIGSGFKYQGLHRLLVSLEQYYKNPYTVRIIVHVIGISLEKSYLKRFINSPILRNFVIFHGFISPNEIDQFADECHFAVNSLNLHQIGLKIACTLKSREYFARGIPFVTSISDDDFADNSPFILKVKGDKNPINIHALIEYAQDLNAIPHHPEEMRQYAIANLDWSNKIKKLNAFFSEVYTCLPNN